MQEGRQINYASQRGEMRERHATPREFAKRNRDRRESGFTPMRAYAGRAGRGLMNGDVVLKSTTSLIAILLGSALAVLQTRPLRAQITAALPTGANKPVWDKGIQPINRESYWNAVECGKQGGERPLCVFYDAGLCKNDDFTLALFTPYKMVAYEVWQAVRLHRDAPTPSYAEAQRTRITVGVTPVKGSKNAITAVNIRRGGRVVKPATQSLDDSGGRFIFDPSAFAPTEDVTIELVGRVKTHTCLVEKPVLTLFR